MHALSQLTIEAHGGLARWKAFDHVSADLLQGGALWALKGQTGQLDQTTVTVGLRAEWASHHPFGADGGRTRFAPGRVAIENGDRQVQEELVNPRTSFAGHTLETPWSYPQLAYFAGCAMWTYLNTPFLLAWPGVETDELEPWAERGETWRRLRVRFPDEIATHSTVQTLYIGDDGLLKRHDYDVEIAGGTPGAHFMDAYTEVSGIKVPTRRRIFPRMPDGTAAAEPLVVSVDLSNIAFDQGDGTGEPSQKSDVG